MTVADSFVADGYCLTAPVVSNEMLKRLRDAAERLFAAMGGAKAGLRDVLARDAVFGDAASLPAVQELAYSVLGADAFIVRSILFDKTPDANWDVVWHQDVTIAVKEWVDVAGFGPWSTKAGIPHVQPPRAILDAMVTIRIHLDDCGPTNGPLLVVPGSHRRGIIDIRSLDVEACDASAVRCDVDAGAAVVMRPLTLHASKKSTSPAHRRVLHLEFAAGPLPSPMQWAIR